MEGWKGKTKSLETNNQQCCLFLLYLFYMFVCLIIILSSCIPLCGGKRVCWRCVGVGKPWFLKLSQANCPHMLLHMLCYHIRSSLFLTVSTTVASAPRPPTLPHAHPLCYRFCHPPLIFQSARHLAIPKAVRSGLQSVRLSIKLIVTRVKNVSALRF